MRIQQSIFTDESETDQHVGLAAMFQINTCIGKFPDESYIITAEMYAVRTAMTKIYETSE